MSWSSRVFIRYFIWLWFAGCAAVLAVSTFHLDKRYGITIGLVLAFTIWPALIGWLAISGFSILWHLVLVAILALHDRERPDFRGVLLFITFLAAGIVFLGGAIGLLCAFVWRALVKA
jgi:hypothetical protein